MVGRLARKTVRRTKLPPNSSWTSEDIFNASAADHISQLLGCDRNVPHDIAHHKKTVEDLYDQTGMLTADGRAAVGYTALQLSPKWGLGTSVAKKTLEVLTSHRINDIELAHTMADTEDKYRSDGSSEISQLEQTIRFESEDYRKAANILKYYAGSRAVAAAEEVELSWPY